MTVRTGAVTPAGGLNLESLDSAHVTPALYFGILGLIYRRLNVKFISS